MPDRNIEDRFDEEQRARGADAGREGYGDDGGTRVGRPDAARGADANRGPSSQPVKEGLEGAVFEGEGGGHSGSTGAGAEAAKGIHDAQDNRAANRDSGIDPDDAGGTRGGADRRGSEPLTGRQEEHKPGYGGEGGAPRTSSDRRE